MSREVSVKEERGLWRKAELGCVAGCAVWVSQIISQKETRSDRAAMERWQSLRSEGFDDRQRLTDADISLSPRGDKQA